MQKIGTIDKTIFQCISGAVVTDEVVITDERIQHIEERHPNTFAKIQPYLAESLANPDYILRDNKWTDTGLVLKQIEKDGIRLQIVLRIQTEHDATIYKNSLISAWEIGERRWNNYVRNKEILYKRA